MSYLKSYKNLIIVTILFVTAFLLSPILDLFLHYLYDIFGIYVAIILGFFYSFSFTGGASAVALSGVDDNFLIYSLLASIGAAFADFTILKIIKTNLQYEINLLISNLKKIIKIKTKLRKNKVLRLIIGLMFIGSPLPDEIGVYILSKTKLLDKKRFLLVTFLANFVFIYLIIKFL